MFKTRGALALAWYAPARKVEYAPSLPNPRPYRPLWVPRVIPGGLGRPRWRHIQSAWGHVTNDKFAAGANFTSGTASIAVSWNSNTTVGNRAFIFVACEVNSGSPTVSSITDPRSNSWHQDKSQAWLTNAGNGSVWTAQIATQILSTDSLTVNFAGSPHNIAWGTAEFSGLDTSATPVDVSASNSFNSTNASSGNTPATNAANELVIRAYMDDGYGATWSTPPSGTQGSATMGDSTATEWYSYGDSGSSGSTPNLTGTLSVTVNAACMCIVYKLAAGGAAAGVSFTSAPNLIALPGAPWVARNRIATAQAQLQGDPGKLPGLPSPPAPDIPMGLPLRAPWFRLRAAPAQAQLLGDPGKLDGVQPLPASVGVMGPLRFSPLQRVEGATAQAQLLGDPGKLPGIVPPPQPLPMFGPMPFGPWASMRRVATVITNVAVTSNSYFGTISDTVGPAVDTVARVFAGFRSITDTVGPASDTVARVFVGARSVTDTVGPATDSVARVGAFARSDTETVGPASDSAQRQGVFFRTDTENVGPATDSVVRVGVFFRVVADTVGPATDTIARVFAGFRSLTETVGPATDSVSRVGAFTRAPSDTVGPATDTVSRLGAFFRAISETVGPASDSVFATKSKLVNITDTVGPAVDAIARVFVGFRSMSETVGPASDSVASSKGLFRSITDTVGPATDSVSAVWRRFTAPAIEFTVARVRDGFAFARVRSRSVTAFVRTGVAPARVRVGAVIARVRDGFRRLIVR